MGVLPLQFKNGASRKTLNLTGSEIIAITGLTDHLSPHSNVKMVITRNDGAEETVDLLCRIDTQNELEYYLHGGILQYVLRKML